MDIREILLLILFIISTYTFISIYIQAKKVVSESEKIKRDSVLIYAEVNNDPMLYYETDKFLLFGKPYEIYENKNSDLILLEHRCAFSKKDNPEYYKYRIGVFFLLVEAEYGRVPLYGLIEDLKTRKFVKVDNTEEFRKEILNAASEMTSLYKEQKITNIKRNHDEPIRCELCEYRIDCIERMT